TARRITTFQRAETVWWRGRAPSPHEQAVDWRSKLRTGGRAARYRRISAITHPARKTPPTNMAKHWRLYFTCSMVEFFCVMPKTTEANSANTTAAEKCDKLMVTVSFLAQCDAHPPPR